MLEIVAGYGAELYAAVLFVLGLVSALLGAGHALLTKRDPRSAAAWVSLCLFFPFFGTLLYLAIGNNRVRTRALKLFASGSTDGATNVTSAQLIAEESLIASEYRNLAALGLAASGNYLLKRNGVSSLMNGEQAYPAMLDAIRTAHRYVYLSSYIFDAREIGAEFIAALADAQSRGVTVRVLIDGFGELYSWPRARPRLARAGVKVARYLPPRLLPPNFSLNLRNHRKILVVDGERAFTGGMNIRVKHLVQAVRPHHGVIDMHFELRGPIVAQIESVFRADWEFCSGEVLTVSEPSTDVAGEAECRVIVDGPNEDLDRLLWVLLGAIAVARRSITIMTPYFLPPRELAVALQTAAMRGVLVRVLLPGRNNFPFMNWAAMHTLGDLMRSGVHVFFSKGPFVHSKLLLVDDYYVQIGSSNLDPRSLRLNFEIAVEVYDHAFAAGLAAHAAETLAGSRELAYEKWRKRSLPRRLRDAFFWLFSPYL